MRLLRKGNLSTLLMEKHTGVATVENSMEFPPKTENGTAVSIDPVILPLVLHPKNPETPIQNKLYIPMFIAAQFIIAKWWKQPKCPSVNKWIKKRWYIYTMEYYTAEKRKELFHSLQQGGWNWRALC